MSKQDLDPILSPLSGLMGAAAAPIQGRKPNGTYFSYQEGISRPLPEPAA